MAEESLSSPGSPSSDLSKYWRRISTGRVKLLYAEERVLPNYIRASTGSCHDLCKFGKRRESEETSRGSLHKRVAMKLPQDKILTQSLDSPLRKRTLSKTTMFKPSSSSRKCDSNGSHFKREVAKLPVRAGDVRKVGTTVGKPSEGLSSGKNKNFLEKMKKAPETLSGSRLANSTVRKQKVLPTFKTVGLSTARVSLKSKEATELNKRVIVSKLKSAAEKSSAVLRSIQESDSATRKKIGVCKPKVAPDSKRTVVPVRASLSQKRLLEKSPSQKTKKGSSLNVLPASENRKEVRPTKAEKPANESKPEEERKDTGEEKTLYVVKMETENELVESSRNERCVVDSPTSDSSSSSSFSSSSGERNEEESECSVTEADVNGAATETQEKSEGSVSEAVAESTENPEESGLTTDEEEEEEEGDNNDVDESLTEDMETPRQRKNRTLSSEDTREDKAVKLNFRRGKILDAKSQDNNSPRRLNFKRGRVLVAGDHTTRRSSVGRRSFKKKGISFNAEEHEPRSVKVVLRHQDTEGKKDSRGLFNNVIEETANKLVETRKSKVKALVGAFERVISLQER